MSSPASTSLSVPLSPLPNSPHPLPPNLWLAHHLLSPSLAQNLPMNRIILMTPHLFLNQRVLPPVPSQELEDGCYRNEVECLTKTASPKERKGHIIWSGWMLSKISSLMNLCLLSSICWDIVVNIRFTKLLFVWSGLARPFVIHDHNQDEHADWYGSSTLVFIGVTCYY